MLTNVTTQLVMENDNSDVESLLHYIYSLGRAVMEYHFDQRDIELGIAAHGDDQVTIDDVKKACDDVKARIG